MRKHFAHKRGMELHMAEACLHALKLESGLSRADPQVTASRKNSASKNMHHRMLQRGIHGARRPPSWPITVLGRSSCAARSAALTSASCTSSCGRGAAGGGGCRGDRVTPVSLYSLSSVKVVRGMCLERSRLLRRRQRPTGSAFGRRTREEAVCESQGGAWFGRGRVAVGWPVELRPGRVQRAASYCGTEAGHGCRVAGGGAGLVH